jgi:hypothetical protein
MSSSEKPPSDKRPTTACAACGLQMAPDYLCLHCGKSVHIFCSIDQTERGHGKKYICPPCFNSSDTDSVEVEVEKGGGSNNIEKDEEVAGTGQMCCNVKCLLSDFGAVVRPSCTCERCKGRCHSNCSSAFEGRLYCIGCAKIARAVSKANQANASAVARMLAEEKKKQKIGDGKK